MFSFRFRNIIAICVFVELAISYLNDKQISLAEISYLLGFSEPSAFHRAFKRWTGSTPGQFRNHLIATR